MKSQKVACALAISTVVGCGVVIANAEEAPKGNKDFTASKTTVVDLGSEIEGMTGRQLRMRLLTIKPGGHIGVHSHKDRPAVVYFMQGDRYGHPRGRQFQNIPFRGYVCGDKEHHALAS